MCGKKLKSIQVCQEPGCQSRQTLSAHSNAMMLQINAVNLFIYYNSNFFSHSGLWHQYSLPWGPECLLNPIRELAIAYSGAILLGSFYFTVSRLIEQPVSSLQLSSDW